MRLALTDAANNCAREDAIAIVTLKSGVQVSGELQKPSGNDCVMAYTETGWVTVLIDEIAAVEARRSEGRRSIR